MNRPDSYFTIKSQAESETKIKGSRFIGRIFKCCSVAEAEEILLRIRKEFYDATHNCFAWKIGIGNTMVFKYSDDGEPSGTAGRPIFDQLEGHNLTDVIIIVTRYYGGTKLGTGGLTHAYSDSASDVIKKAGIVECFITDRFDISLDFSDYNSVERLIRNEGASITESDFSSNVKLTIEIRLSKLDGLKEKLIDLTSGRVKFG